jgi:16S rRNA (uracil1498-N3)-methyltransferase
MSSSRPWLLVEDGTLEPGSVVDLGADEARHVATVLRATPGMEVVVTDGRGTRANAVVAAIGRGRVEVEIADAERLEVARSGDLTLALGVLHSKAMDWAVQKAVEVGVGRFVPLLTARSQLAAAAAAGRRPHWQRLALQALKQCHRVWAMEVAGPEPLAAFVAGTPPGVVAAADGGSLAVLDSGSSRVLVVGPEGGLCDDERRLLERRGWDRLCLGPHILRAETAAVVGAALLGLRAESEGGPG